MAPTWPASSAERERSNWSADTFVRVFPNKHSWKSDGVVTGEPPLSRSDKMKVAVGLQPTV
jgi:hypothetical protein